MTFTCRLNTFLKHSVSIREEGIGKYYIRSFPLQTFVLPCSLRTALQAFDLRNLPASFETFEEIIASIMKNRHGFTPQLVAFVVKSEAFENEEHLVIYEAVRKEGTEDVVFTLMLAGVLQGLGWTIEDRFFLEESLTNDQQCFGAVLSNHHYDRDAVKSILKTGVSDIDTPVFSSTVATIVFPQNDQRDDPKAYSVVK